MKSRPYVLPGIFLALNSVGEMPAQDRPNRFYLTSPLSMSAGYDDNFVVNSRAEDDTVFNLASPTFTWFRSTHRTRFSADYQAEFEFFNLNPSLNAWNHSATLRESYRINSRLSFDAGNAFLSTSDASRRLADSRFLLPRGRFLQNSFFSGLQYRVDYRTKLFFRFDNAITKMALTGPRARRFDQMANAGTVTIDHTLNRQHSITGSYAYLHVRQLDRTESEVDAYQPAHSLNAGYMYSLNSGLIIRATGGVVHGREVAYTAGGAVEKRLGGLWVMAGYQRYLSFFGGFAPSGGLAAGNIEFANGLAPSSVFQTVSLRVRGNLTRRIGVDIHGQRGHSNIADWRVKSTVAQSRLDYKLSERLAVFARAEYYGQNAGQFIDSPLARRRYVGGIEIILSRPPEPEDSLRRRGKIPVESAEPPAEPPLTPEEI